MKKKVLTILLCVALIVTMMPVTGFAESGENLITGACGPDATYIFNVRYGELKINGSGSVTESPWVANGWVKQIRDLYVGENISSLYQSEMEAMTKLEYIFVRDENQTYKAIDGVLFNHDATTLICYPQNRWNSEYIIPETVENISCDDKFSIGFRGARNLYYLAIPNGVREINGGMFADSSIALFDIAEDNMFYQVANSTIAASNMSSGSGSGGGFSGGGSFSGGGGGGGGHGF